MNKKRIVGFIALLVMMFTLTACGNKLDGDYKGKVHFMFTETTDTLTFKGDSVEEKQDGKVINKGTYTISDGKLNIKLGEYHMVALLSQDKKSFVVQSAEGLANLAKGTTYDKK